MEGGVGYDGMGIEGKGSGRIRWDWYGWGRLVWGSHLPNSRIVCDAARRKESVAESAGTSV